MDKKNARALISQSYARPGFSNFTDFMLLENLNGVSLRYVDRPSKLGSPDMIILPGTKNTMEDLRWMRQNGLEARVVRAASHGTVIWGICGGYQMLGDILRDPEGIEAGGTMKGWGCFRWRPYLRRKRPEPGWTEDS